MIRRWFERIPQALGWHLLMCKCGVHDYDLDDTDNEIKCKDCGEYDFWFLE